MFYLTRMATWWGVHILFIQGLLLLLCKCMRMRQMEQSEGECVLTTTQHTCCIHLCNVVNNLFRVHSSVSLFALVLIASCINIQPTFLDTKQRLETIMSVHPKKKVSFLSPLRFSEYLFLSAPIETFKV